MNHKSNTINDNHSFSPIRIIPSKNSSRSQHNIFSSSERKKKSLEKSQDFLSSTIKKNDEEEYEEIIQKRNNFIKKIDEVILSLSKNNLKKQPTIEENKRSHKYLFENIKNKDSEVMKQNEALKEKNAYLKKIIKEIGIKKDLNNSFNSEKNGKNLNYDFLLKQNQELIDENRNLKEEYNLLKLDLKSNSTLDKLLENKYEVVSKIQLLNYSMNNLLNLLNINEFNQTSSNNFNNIYNNRLLKSHNTNKYDLPLKKDSQEHKNSNQINSSKSKINTDIKVNNDDILFTEGGNLNTNNNSGFYNDEDNNINDSSDDEKFEIYLKKFEKTENKNINNFLINREGVNINQNQNKNIMTIQNKNKKMAIFNEKKKNTINANSYSKEIINNKKIRKDFNKCFNEEKCNKDNYTNYNFINFRNICLDKKNNIENTNKNSIVSYLKNNRTSSNFKISKTNGKKNKGINDNFRNQKNYKNNNNNFKKPIKSFKKIFK